MSNMLYCCSILYKFKLPFIIVFNKTDVQDEEFAKTWMTDFEKFQEALHKRKDSYMNSLMSSMCLVLDEFYQHIKVNIILIIRLLGFRRLQGITLKNL